MSKKICLCCFSCGEILMSAETHQTITRNFARNPVNCKCGENRKEIKEIKRE